MTTVYLVDDEPLVTRVVERGLRKAGYEVQAFHDGRDVLEAVSERTPDALVTDIEMPLMSGKELSEALCARYPERSFPIFVVTSATDLSHRQWSSELPEVYFLEKPVSMRELLAQLSRVLAG